MRGAAQPKVNPLLHNTQGRPLPHQERVNAGMLTLRIPRVYLAVTQSGYGSKESCKLQRVVGKMDNIYPICLWIGII
jgi:hypothetical protein